MRYDIPAAATPESDDIPTAAANFLRLRAAASHPEQHPDFIDPVLDPLIAYDLVSKMDAFACWTDDGELVGAMTVSEALLDEPEARVLDALAVAPHLRGKHQIGRRGLVLAARHTLEMSATHLVGVAQPDAVQFYTKHGFTAAEHPNERAFVPVSAPAQRIITLSVRY